MADFTRFVVEESPFHPGKGILMNLGKKEISIVIAGCSQGSGHMSAAQNLVESINEMDDSVSTGVVNILDYISPFDRFLMEDVWEYSSLHLDKLYSSLHGILIRSKPLSSYLRAHFRSVAGTLTPLLAESRTNVFVATHPLAVIIGSLIKKKYQMLCCVVPTDFVVHNLHLHPAVDYYFLPSESTIITPDHVPSRLREKMVVTGIPISPQFCHRANKDELLKKYKLKDHTLTVLISFGGKGLGAAMHLSTLAALFSLRIPLQFIVIAGGNEHFRKNVENLAAMDHGNPVNVFGVVDNDDMADLMTISDVFIGKAGGLSLSEALAMELPVAIIDHLAGQEEYNTEFIVNNGIGILARNNDDLLINWLMTLASPGVLAEWKFRVRKYSRPFGAFSISNHILKVLKNSPMH